MTTFKEIKHKVNQEFAKHFTAKAYIQYFFDGIHREFVLIPLNSIPLVVRIKNFQECFILRKPDSYLYGKPVYKCVRGYALSIESDFLDTTKKQTIEIVVNSEIDKTIVEIQKGLQYLNDSNLILEYKNHKIVQMKKINVPDSYERDKDIEIYESDFKNNKNVNGKLHIRTNILEKRDIERNSSFEIDTWSQTGYNKILLRDKLMDIQVIFLIICLIIITILGTWLVADNYFESYYRQKFKANSLIFPIIEHIGVLCQILFLMI